MQKEIAEMSQAPLLLTAVLDGSRRW
jgi:hypothetical protein